MRNNIIGRKSEQDTLARIYESRQSEFVAVCGRRRVGKTFLIREYFEEEMVFQASGLAGANTQEQLKNFFYTLRRYDKSVTVMPHDWLEAFEMLISYLDSLVTVGRKVVFLDELPWMDTANSGFISALEHFWNGWASARRDIVLVVCGSATSWMMDKLINNHGGLYGRLTHRLFLQPLSLGETELFLKAKGMMLSRYETAEAYVTVVECLNERGYGMIRTEIAEAAKMKSGKTLTTVLDNLESCGFIRKYVNYGCSSRKSLYQLVDFFTLFYFRFLRDSSFRNLLFWSKLQRTPRFYAWAGISFEILAMNHIDAIKRKLGISGVATCLYSWRSKGGEPAEGEEHRAAQIDMVIERGDNTVNLCEMKFSEGKFAIGKDYERVLRNKIACFIEETKTRKSVLLTFVSSYGLQRNMYSGIAQNEVVLDDLFL